MRVEKGGTAGKYYRYTRARSNSTIFRPVGGYDSAPKYVSSNQGLVRIPLGNGLDALSTNRTGKRILARRPKIQLPRTGPTARDQTSRHEPWFVYGRRK